MYYIQFFGDGPQTWSLENICFNSTKNDPNQIRFSDDFGNVNYSKKVNFNETCSYYENPANKTIPRPTTKSKETKDPIGPTPVEPSSDSLVIYLIIGAAVVIVVIGVTWYLRHSRKLCWTEKSSKTKYEEDDLARISMKGTSRKEDVKNSLLVDSLLEGIAD